jgi:hypothetical protein
MMRLLVSVRDGAQAGARTQNQGAQPGSGNLSDDCLLLFDVQGALELRRELLGGARFRRVRVLFGLFIADIEEAAPPLFSVHTPDDKDIKCEQAQTARMLQEFPVHLMLAGAHLII